MLTLEELTRRQVTRRLTVGADVAIVPDMLWQAMDVDVRLDAGTTVAYPAVPGYERIAVDVALERISSIASMGLRGVTVRVIDDPVSSTPEWAARRGQWGEALRQVAAAARRHDVEVVVDPFSAALRETGQWGLLDSDDPDGADTLRLLEELAATVAEAGAAGIVTLGRVPGEVEATKRVVAGALKIFSFSTNSETVAAYAGHGNHAVTGQKILPGNTVDMLLWALLDIRAGTDVVVTKPIENFHTVVETRLLLEDPERLRRFLDSEKVQRALTRHPDGEALRNELVTGTDDFIAHARAVEFGAYTVSGTTQMLATVARAHGVELAHGRQAELWVNAAAAAGDRPFSIIDRGATAFLSGSVLH